MLQVHKKIEPVEFQQQQNLQDMDPNNASKFSAIGRPMS